MKWSLPALLAMAGLVSAGDRFTEEQLKARFYYDLGPAEVDVSVYPERQRANYKIFAKTCSQCHTLARPINSPLIERKDWKRYVRRMHLKTKFFRVPEFSKEDAQVILDFLEYDSRIRKKERKQEFDAQAEELERSFAMVRKERLRRQVEEDRAKVRTDPGPVQPGPRP